MDFSSLISFLLYLVTFIFGFVIDFRDSCRKYKRAYILWLYIFLCFGYMTGSDWRDYELEYTTGTYLFNETEFGFTFIYDLASKIGLDFWLFAGLMKCLYLSAQIRLLKKLTTYTTSCLSICMVTSLLFMLIDYPMRFTAASTFLLFAIPYLFQRKVLRFIVLSSIGIIFHNTIIITIMICLLSYLITDKLLAINKYILSAIFIVFAFIVSNVSRITFIQEVAMAFFIGSGGRNFSSYMAENNNSFFTIGSFLNIFLACLVFFVKGFFLKENPKDKLILKFAIVSSFFFRILLIIPTGYRLTIPLSVFATIIIITYCYRNNIKILYGFIILYFMTLCKDVYNGFVYIPYSNSIPYIITQDHLPYNERDQYNFTKYRERKGREFERDE